MFPVPQLEAASRTSQAEALLNDLRFAYDVDIHTGMAHRYRTYAIITSLNPAGEPMILLKERSNQRSHGGYFDLPGGESTSSTSDRHSLSALVEQQLGVKITEVTRFGNSMWQTAVGAEDTVDCALAWTANLNEVPTPNLDHNTVGCRWFTLEELKEVQVINLASDLDPAKSGRMGLMILAGLEHARLQAEQPKAAEAGDLTESTVVRTTSTLPGPHDHLAKSFSAVRPFSFALVDAVVSRCDLHYERTLLDVHCGSGFYTIPIYQTSEAWIIGVEPSAALIAEARNAAPNVQIDWQEMDIEAFPTSVKVDAILLNGVAHRLIEEGRLGRIIRRLSQNLNSGGTIMLSYCSPMDMASQPHANLFPGVLQRAMARAAQTSDIIRELKSNGFEKPIWDGVSQDITTDVDFLLRIGEQQGTSTLRQMAVEDPQGYQRALDSYRESIARNYGTGSVTYDYSLSLITAYKK